MAQQLINLGAAPNDHTGDDLRTGGDKINDNFTELYAGLTGLVDYKGNTNCSANPNYPAAAKGDFYLVSVAGRIGGGAGIVVEAGDSYFATADNAGGTQAAVGASWAVVQGNIVGSLGATELDDLTDVNAPAPAAGDVLTWDDTPGEWVPAAPSGGGAFALDDATDVDTSGAAAGDVLTFDGADWAPAAPSGGAPWDFVPPLAADFTLFSGDAGAATLTDDADVGLKVTGTTAASGGITRGGYKALPAGDFDVRMKIMIDADTVTDIGVGLSLYESATNKCKSLLLFGSPGSGVAQIWNQPINAGAVTTTVFGAYHLLSAQGLWLRFARVGSTINVYFSYTGKAWILIESVAQTTPFTTAPNRVGPAIYLRHASKIPTLYVPFWSQSW